jgi:integral membrane protein (TIGR01906 family)
MKIAKAFSAIGCFLLGLTLLVSIIDWQCFLPSFYQEEYQKNQTAELIGMSQEDLDKATNALLDYLRDKRQDIVVTAVVNGSSQEVYNDRETRHMVDVKALYQRAILLRNLALAAGAVMIAAVIYLHRKDWHYYLRFGYRTGMSVLLVLIAAIAVYASSDFYAFWYHFHELLFTNDLWLLDPNTSIMINMVPGSFFSDLVMRIILWFTAISVGFGIVLFWPFLPGKKEA